MTSRFALNLAHNRRLSKPLLLQYPWVTWRSLRDQCSLHNCRKQSWTRSTRWVRNNIAYLRRPMRFLVLFDPHEKIGLWILDEADKSRKFSLIFSGFGSLGKLFLVYNQPWWSADTSSINIVTVDGCTTNSPATDKLFGVFHPMAWNNNVLQGWLSGPAPAAVDAMTDDQVSWGFTLSLL